LEPDKPNPQDDSRFFRSEEEENKQESEEKKIPIQLPEIELPIIKKESPSPPEEDKTKEDPPAPEPEKTEPVKEVVSEKNDFPEEISKEKKQKKKKISIKNPFEKLWKSDKLEDFQLFEFLADSSNHLLLVYIVTVLFFISLFVNIYFLTNISRLKSRMGSEAKLVEDMVIDKEKIATEKKSLVNTIDRLKVEFESVKDISNNLKKQNENLKGTIAAGKAEYLELEETLKEYAEELRELATKRMGYYTGYKKEQENTKKLSSTINDLEGRIDNLRNEMGSIYDRYKDKEAEYIYNMALLYVEAGMFDEAIESFKNFLDLNKDDAGAHYNLAFIYEHARKDRKRAISYYKKYLKLNPNAEDLYEIKMKIASLEKGGKRTRTGLKGFKIRLNDLKY